MSKLTFKKNDPLEKTAEDSSAGTVKVIIADDEPEVHAVTRFVLKDYRFQGKKIEFLSAYSGAEAKKLIEENPDASLILLDIVMEKDDAGLDVAEYIRESLHNNLIRIILRTGQPGMAPEEDVISRYDVNDYKEKTELTDRKFKTAMTMALRAYTDIVTIDSFRNLLEREVQARTAELVEKNRELERLNQELELQASRDSLTGAYNRMKFDWFLDNEIKRCVRYARTMTLAMLDIDHFKSVNDRHGHAGGDAALRQLVKLVQTHIRESDVLARWGGEEFMILFIETSLDESQQVSEKIRQRIESHTFDVVGSLTCSIGLTQMRQDDTPESLNDRVDEALYEAKRNGRNKLVFK